MSYVVKIILSGHSSRAWVRPFPGGSMYKAGLSPEIMLVKKMTILFQSFNYTSKKIYIKDHNLF